VLLGPEPLLIDELLQRITATLLPDPSAAAMSREVLHADQVTAEAIVAAGSALALFAGRRLVVVRGVGDLGARPVDRLREAIEAARRPPAGWPGEGVTVVLAAAVADRKAPVLRLAGLPETVELRPPAGRALHGWLGERARAAGLELTPGAATALVDLVGEDLARLATELEKAAVHAGDDRRVTEEVVRALAGETRTRHYWDLTEALESARRSDALKILDRLLAAREEPLAILTWVAGYPRTLWRVQGGLGDSDDARRIAPLLRGPRRPEFAVRQLIARAQAVGPAGITRASTRCFEVELTLKSGGGRSARSLLTALVDELGR
jgi:DNA polymerase-3 subunit delta